MSKKSLKRAMSKPIRCHKCRSLIKGANPICRKCSGQIVCYGGLSYSVVYLKQQANTDY